MQLSQDVPSTGGQSPAPRLQALEPVSQRGGVLSAQELDGSSPGGWSQVGAGWKGDCAPGVWQPGGAAICVPWVSMPPPPWGLQLLHVSTGPHGKPVTHQNSAELFRRQGLSLCHLSPIPFLISPISLGASRVSALSNCAGGVGRVCLGHGASRSGHEKPSSVVSWLCDLKQVAGLL